MTQQLPLQGPRKMYCVCGCDKYGSPRRKVWRGETVGHVKLCECNRCTGGRVKARARTRENRIAKDTGLTRSYASGAHSGNDLHGSVLVEETAQTSLVAGIRRTFESKQFQAKTARIRAQNRQPWAFLASWDGKPQAVLTDYQSFRELVQLAQMDRRGISPERLRQTLEQLIEEAS